MLFYLLLSVISPLLKGAVVIYGHKMDYIHASGQRQSGGLALEQRLILSYVNTDIRQVNRHHLHVASHGDGEISHYFNKPDELLSQ